MKKFLQYTAALVVLLSTAGIKAQSIKEAQTYMRNEMYESAEKVLTQIIADKPKNHEAHYLLGLNHQTRGENDLAMKAFQNGLTNAPKCKINQVGVGSVKLLSGDADGAAQDFTAALSQSKKKLKAELNREIGRAYINKGNDDDENALFWGKMAVSYLKQANTLKPADFETTLLLGDAYMLSSKSDASNATEQYILAERLNPNDPMPLIKQADVYRRAGNPGIAKTYAEKAISKDQEFAPGYRVMGSILSDLKQNEEALKYFQEYLKRNDNLSARRQYVSSLYLNGKYEEAIKEGKDLLSKKEYPNIYGVIALAHVSANKEDDIEFNKEGLKYFELWQEKSFKAKNKEMGSFELYQMAILLQRTGQKDAAEGVFLNVVKDTANVTSSLLESVAGYMYKNENYAKYVELTELKIAKNGESTLKDKIDLGSGYSKMGDYTNAIRVYRDILKQDSTQVGAYKLLARTHMQIDTNDVSGNAQRNYMNWINGLTPEKYNESKDLIKQTYQVMAGAAQRRKDWVGMMKQFENIVAIDPDDEKSASYLAKLKAYVESQK